MEVDAEATEAAEVVIETHTNNNRSRGAGGVWWF